MIRSVYYFTMCRFKLFINQRYKKLLKNGYFDVKKKKKDHNNMSNNYLKSKWLSLRKNVLATLRLMIPWVLLPPKTFCQVCEMTKQNGRKKIYVINEQPPSTNYRKV